MRLRAQSYHDLDGTQLERAAASVPWYWRAIAIASSAMILGGFLMLPVTYDSDPQLRVSQVGVGVFAAVVLVAGFCATGLICLVVQSLPYRTDTVFMPAFLSCVLGFGTVWYCFITSGRYTLNVFAIIQAVVSAVGAFAYGFMLIITNRRISRDRASPVAVQLREEFQPPTREPNIWQSPQYYQNYVKNMFPSASYEPHNIAPQEEPAAISEDELQRQQMLMLLLNQEPNASSDAALNETFRIEWQGQDHEPNTPLHPHFRSSAYLQSAQHTPGSARLQVPGQLRPWDGIWRGVSQQSRVSEMSSTSEASDSRETRRREIEMGA